MLKIKNILFPTDFSNCSKYAFQHAVYLADKYKATLHMLHAIVLFHEDPHEAAFHIHDTEELHHKLENLASEETNSIIASIKPKTAEIIKVQKRGITAADVILDYAQEHNIDLIVMGTHGRSGIKNLLLGSVAEKVVQLAHCSVLSIRELKDPKPLEDLENILVPIDFSDYSRQALSYAKELAKEYQCKLGLLHVVEDRVDPAVYATDKMPISDLMPDVKKKSTDLMKQQLEESPGPEVQAYFSIVEGHAASEIIGFSEKYENDLIVISTHGQSGLENFLFGSVTEKVVRRSACPVFTVKAFGKSLI
jgi:nucleotide-binding universal stress UspA family protein